MKDRFYSCELCFCMLSDKLLRTDTHVFKEENPATLTLHPLDSSEENYQCNRCSALNRFSPAMGWIDVVEMNKLEI